MFNKELDNFFSTKEGTWDKMIAFSPKDVATILNNISVHERGEDKDI